MRYRTLGRTGLTVSEIGLGLEHLLFQDQAVVTDTIRTAVEGGVNYIDCLSHDLRNIAKLRDALDGIREKVYLSYIAYYEVPAPDTERNFETFLQQTKTDYVDIFMISRCDKIEGYETVTSEDGLLSYAKKLQQDHKIRFIGFSTHSCGMACQVAESGIFDVLMYPVNPAFDVVYNEEKYTDELVKLWDAVHDYNPQDRDATKLRRKAVYNACFKNNIGLVAMKPFAGGILLNPDMNPGFTPVQLISYALNQTGVSTVIPGCVSPMEMTDILAYYSCRKEALDFSSAVSKSRWNVKGNCQYCSHCLPCTAGIDIAGIHRMADNGLLAEYRKVTAKASSCLKCGECEKRCPFEVRIIEKMESTAKLFE